MNPAGDAPAWPSGPAADATAGKSSDPATQAPAAVSANARRDVDDRISINPSSRGVCNVLPYGATDSDGTVLY